MNPQQQISTQSEREPLPADVNMRLLVLLADRALKQADLARLIGKDRSYVNRIVHGELPPDAIKIKIARSLNTDSRAIWPTQQEENQ